MPLPYANAALAEPEPMDQPAQTAAFVPPYYLGDFRQVIADVRARYGFLLHDRELRHLEHLDHLTAPALMLYARLVNRRGPCFRLARLKYPEIGNLHRAAAELLAARLLVLCDATLDQADRARLLGCFTHAELLAELHETPGHAAPKTLRKPELLAWLEQWDHRTVWLDGLLRSHAAVRVPRDDPWPFLRFLFFGELRDNLSAFVTRALGHVVTEQIGAEHLRPHFTSRRQADDAYRMATLYQDFRRIRDTSTAPDALAWWQLQAVGRAALLAGTGWFDRLVDRLGHLLERDGEMAAALALYETSPVAPARERRARLLLKMERTEEAATLLEEMQTAPCHTEEAYAARQLLARLQKTSRRSEARHYQQTSRSIELDYPDGGVEAAMLAHYHRQGWHGVHSENWLWNASFGLLCWDIIYDPAAGGFHSPLQFAPSDLHEPAFYQRRRLAIETRLEMLANPAAAQALAMQHFNVKHGMANPFVYWHDDLPELLAIMLHRLPCAGHAAALRHLAQDVRRHARGLPDLFLWRESDYRFVEIKAENDHLAPHQYEWLRVLGNAGISVSLEKVTRPAGAALAAHTK